MKKDLFSDHASIYAAFRPTYPDALYEFIFKHVAVKNNAWDCATGNGQVAGYLARHFKEVKATDISQQQLDNAVRAINISYSVSPAERTSFSDNEFDLITVGQALHWFNNEDFFNEVKRIGKQDSVLAVWGYQLCSVNPEIDILFSDYYNNTVGSYWDSGRKLIENEYRDIEFPFEEIRSPKFEIQLSWTLEHYVGYLRSWSATQKYIKANGVDPLVSLSGKLKLLWKPETTHAITFPVFLRLSKITK